MYKKVSVARRARKNPLPCTGCININVYHTVFFQSTNSNKNEVTPAVVEDQMRVLNDRFSDTPFTFTNAAEPKFVVNNNHFAFKNDNAFANQYRKGNYADLKFITEVKGPGRCSQRQMGFPSILRMAYGLHKTLSQVVARIAVDWE